MRARRLLAVVAVAAVMGGRVARADVAACEQVSGHAASRCLKTYLAHIDGCRLSGNAACETTARGSGGALPQLLGETGTGAVGSCSQADADTLGYLAPSDITARVPESCSDVAEDLLTLTWGASPPPSAPVACRREVLRQRQRLVGTVTTVVGVDCFLAAANGRSCNRARRDRRVDHARRRAARAIRARCGASFDALGLAEGPTLEARIASVTDTVTEHLRFFAERVYPSPLLGPTAQFGPYPVGVRTLDLVDPSRTDVSGTGPRPVRVEVWYPSTTAAVAGVARDVAQVFGIDVAATPTYRDVTRADGRFPVVLFSHGNGGIRFQSLFYASHLASHGYIVASPDHHGNTFTDAFLGIVDPTPATNRPLDMHFLLDQILAMDGDPTSFLSGGVDAARIGMSGHSFGGYTTFAVGGGPFALGTFTDTRIKALLPMAPATPFDDGFFATVGLPTLMLGGSLDVTTPFATQQQRAFDLLPSGATIVGLGELMGAGHFSFSDICEVPRNLVGAIGGFDEACEPRHLPWRWARRLVGYLAVNFFDATLRGDADARARLAAAVGGTVDDVVYREK